MVRRARNVRLLLSTAAVGTAAVVAGCGGSSAAPSANSAGHSKSVSLVRAADISSGAAGYKMDMTMHETFGGQSVDMNANGSFTPKSHQGSMTMIMALPPSLGGRSLNLQIVLANGTIYVQLPASAVSKIPGHKPWVSVNLSQLGNATKLPGLGSMSSYSSTLTNPGEYLDFLRAAAAGSVKNLGQETVDGVQTTHYQAQLDFAKLPDAVPPAQRAAAQQLVNALEKRANVSNPPVDVWIDGSNLVRRIRMTIDETIAGHAVSVAVTENFTSYGPQPAPTVPGPAQTTDLLSLMHAG